MSEGQCQSQGNKGQRLRSRQEVVGQSQSCFVGQLMAVFIQSKNRSTCNNRDEYRTIVPKKEK